MKSKAGKIIGIVAIVFAFVNYFLFNPALFELNENNGFRIGVYDDSDEGGNSTITQLENHGYEVSIGNTYSYPFAGIYFQKIDSTLFFVDEGQVLNLELTSEVNAKIQLEFVKFQVTGNRPFSYHRFVEVEPGQTTISVPLEHFSTPPWWLEQNPTAKGDELLASDLISFNIEVKNIPDQGELKIDHVTFTTKENKFKYSLTAIFIAIGFLFLFIRREKNRVIENNSEVINNDEHHDPIVNYVHNKFSSGSFSVNFASEELGLSVEELNTLLQNKTGMNFRDYVKELRVKKAQKLLKETDEKAFEIAFLCGFNSSASFSQTFKAATGLTPNDYRKSSSS